MANVGLSDRVRSLVTERYVLPALQSGKTRISVGVKDVLNDFSEKGGFPRFRTPVICQALMGDKLLRQNGLEIESVDGPESKQSRRVVVHYRVAEGAASSRSEGAVPTPATEDPEARAKRIVDGLRGLLKDEIASFGGTEAFIRWVRSDEEEAA